MTNERFNQIVDEWVKRIKSVLQKKGKEYSNNDGRLGNFIRAAEMQGDHPIKCLQMFKLKHDVSVADMIDDVVCDGVKYPRELWMEKLGDQVNYTILLSALLEDLDLYKDLGSVDKPTQTHCCFCGSELFEVMDTGVKICGVHGLEYKNEQKEA